MNRRAAGENVGAPLNDFGEGAYDMAARAGDISYR